MPVRALSDLTAVDLATWEQPQRGDITGRYWAATTGRGSRRLPFDVVLPRGAVRATGVLPHHAITAYVDSVEGWLWVAVERDTHYWHPGDHLRDYRRQDEVVPAWVLGKYAKYPHQDDPERLRPFLVRRPLADGEAAAYLDELMPPAAAYPIGEELAAPLRAGGWTPDDLTHLWWTVETVEDATALAARPPHWWDTNRWPMRLSTVPRIQGIPRPKARDLAALRERGVRGDTVRACRDEGFYDLTRILHLRPPTIPDDAARIEFTDDRNPWYAYTADAARKHADKYPKTWLRPVVIETGDVVPVHVDPVQHLLVWSDGRLDEGELLGPDALLAGRFAFTRLRAAGHLLPLIARARNRSELDPGVWMAWMDADRGESELVRESTRQHPIAPGILAGRRVSLTRHTIHRGDTTHTLWQVDQSILVQEAHQTVPEVHETTSHFAFYTSETDALAALDAASDDLPPVMTVPDMARILDTTEPTLSQALRHHRATLNSRDDGPPYLDPGYVATTLRTSWYEPRAVRVWWDDGSVN